MNKYRLENLIIGIVLILQPILVIFTPLKGESNYFLSGFGMGIGVCIIIFSEVMIPLLTQYNQKEVKSNGRTRRT